MPAPTKNVAGQLQDAKQEIAKLKTQLENLSTLEESSREQAAENEHLRALLEQAKQAATNNTGKARITDLDTQVNELSAQLSRSQKALQVANERLNSYEQKILAASDLENRLGRATDDLRNTVMARDAVADQLRNTTQRAKEQIAEAEERATNLNQQLRNVMQEYNRYREVVTEVRTLLREQPDVIAALKMKVGLPT